MSDVWTPPEREIDSLTQGVLDAARATIMPIGEIGVVRDPGGWMIVPLKGGGEARVALEARAEGRRRVGSRDAVVYGFSGNASHGRQGYAVEGRATVDVATKAFLECECRLQAVGRV